MIAFSTGLVLFFHHRLHTLTDPGESYILGLLILAAAAWAGYGLAQKQLLKHIRTNDLLLLLYVAGTPLFTAGLGPRSNPATW